MHLHRGPNAPWERALRANRRAASRIAREARCHNGSTGNRNNG